MKLIGLIGGVTWVSTVDYYRALNRMVAGELGGHHSARLALYSLDFAEMAEAQKTEDWERAGDLIIGAARALEAAGAELFLICANTLHLVFERVVEETGLPFVHIVDATGGEAARLGMARLGLTGTKFTMEKPFYRERLERRFGLETLVPPESDRNEIHRIIYDELGRDQVLERSRRAFHGMVENLAARGADAVILGCTELPLLLGPEDTAVPLLNPLILQCREAVRRALPAE